MSASYEARLKEIMALEDGWLEGASKISPEASESAAKLLDVLFQEDIPRPSIFPTFDGGILIEWANPSWITNIECLSEGDRYDLFDLNVETRDVLTSLENATLEESIIFARSALTD